MGVPPTGIIPSLSAWKREPGAGVEPRFQRLPGWDERGRLDRPRLTLECFPGIPVCRTPPRCVPTAIPDSPRGRCSRPWHHALLGTFRWLRAVFLLRRARQDGFGVPRQTKQHPVFHGYWMRRPQGKKKNPTTTTTKKKPSAGGFEKLERARWGKERNIPRRSGNIQGEMQPAWKISRDLPDGIQN